MIFFKGENMTKLNNDSQTYAIIGAAMEVHKQLGPGFLEAVYQEALAVEFIERNIPFSREVELPVYYKGQPLACYYRADFVCYNSVLVELKAIPFITNIERAQILNYLKSTKMEIGMLTNFGNIKLMHERFIFTNDRKLTRF
jgi:GxxExxY protein